MLVVRGTKRLRDRVKAPFPDDCDVSTTALGDWFATALFWRPQVALLVNARTLLPVFMPLAPAVTLLDRLPEAIEDVLQRHGVDQAILATELAAMGETRLAPTNSRSVVGVMNEFAFHGEFRYQRDAADLVVLSVEMAKMSLGPLRSRTGFPDRELAALLGADHSNVVQFPIPKVPGVPTPTSVVTSADRNRRVYQLKVTLLDTKPPVWRRVLVDGSSTLDRVHEVIQAAFGWWNYHLHDFEVGRTSYGIPDPEWDFGPPSRDERRTRLDEVATPGTSFRYTYDFGDNWVHKVTVEKALNADPTIVVPACIDGRRACPPEDCGGPWGYRDLLAILDDPTHPEHNERVEWLSGVGEGRVDPAAFDPNEFDGNLQNVRLSHFPE